MSANIDLESFYSSIFSHILWIICQLQCDLSVCGYGNAQRKERIKCCWYIITSLAVKSWLKLTIKQINNNRFVSFKKSLPMFFRYNLIVSPIRVFLFNIRFLLYSIQIFMNCINQISKQLIWILLCITSKLFCHFSNSTLHIMGSNSRWTWDPHFLH